MPRIKKVLSYKPEAMKLRNSQRKSPTAVTDAMKSNGFKTDRLWRHIKTQKKKELMTENDFTKILPGEVSFQRTFLNERKPEEDLVIRGESKLEREINHA